MKKLIPLMILLVGVSGALAQGTVNFRNNQTDFPTLGIDRDIYAADMVTPLVGTNFQARLVFGADAASLQPATYTTPARFRAVTTGAALAGTWSGDTRTLPGYAPGSTVMLQVQVWDSTGGRTFDEVRAAGGANGAYGLSAPFAYTVPPAGTLNPQPYYLDNLRSFSIIVPEPSVIGLGLIGVGALFMLRRRKA
jgi:hypothetical protein